MFVFADEPRASDHEFDTAVWNKGESFLNVRICGEDGCALPTGIGTAETGRLAVSSSFVFSVEICRLMLLGLNRLDQEPREEDGDRTGAGDREVGDGE